MLEVETPSQVASVSTTEKPDGSETRDQQRRRVGRHRPEAGDAPADDCRQPVPGLGQWQRQHRIARQVALAGEDAQVDAWGVLLAGDSPQALDEPLEDKASAALRIEHAGDGIGEQQVEGIGVGLLRRGGKALPSSNQALPLAPGTASSPARSKAVVMPPSNNSSRCGRSLCCLAAWLR